MAGAGTGVLGSSPRRSKLPTPARNSDHRLRVELEREEDGRWLAPVIALPGVMAYGLTPEEAVVAAEKLLLHIVLDRLDHGEDVPALTRLFSMVA